MEAIKERLAFGKSKYGHGVRVDDDTTTWGTPTNSWMEMAREEFLDAVVYVTADYIRQGRETEKCMCDMEIAYSVSRPGFLDSEDVRKWFEENREYDDNNLIEYILNNWENMEPCKHKTLLCTLFNIIS